VKKPNIVFIITDSLRPHLGFDYWFAKPKGHTRSFCGADPETSRRSR
jgi:hypothetical protein